jgi:hypothetical protein
MTKMWTYSFGPDNRGTLHIGEVDVVKRTAKTSTVTPNQASGYGVRISNDRLFDTQEQAVAAARPNADKIIELYRNRIRRYQQTLGDTPFTHQEVLHQSKICASIEPGGLGTAACMLEAYAATLGDES